MRYGIISDVHAPFHSEEYYLAIDCLADSVDCLIINGDFLDMFNVSAYGKDPDVQFRLQDELLWGKEELNRLSKIFSKIIFLEGNHEDRLSRYIADKCPVFWNICNLQRELNFEQLGIEFHQYQEEFLITHNLRLQHSPPSYGVNLARTSMLKKPGASYIYGCSHRLDWAVMNLSNGGTCEVHSFGWLGSLDRYKANKKVFKYAKNHKQWQNGFGIVDIDRRGNHHIESCHIKDGIVKADGNIWEI